ncbi:Peptidyl-prolyl cis-trans isomerase cyp15, partial [Spiromyces aspiralis]
MTDKIHSSQVKLMAVSRGGEDGRRYLNQRLRFTCADYNPPAHCVVSVDVTGMVEYWVPEEPYNIPDTVDFEVKSQTDLYEFKKKKAVPLSLTFSPDFSLFACICGGDLNVRVFRFRTGKLYREYDESITAVTNLHQAKMLGVKIDDMEFGRRIALERELLKGPQSRYCNVVFDESGYFLTYGTLVGIKTINIYTNRVVSILGSTEPHRFINLALFQGSSKKSKVSL